MFCGGSNRPHSKASFKSNISEVLLRLEIGWWKAVGAQTLIENRGVWGFGWIAAAVRAVLIEREQVDFKERNEYKYFEWRKGESREIVFD